MDSTPLEDLLVATGGSLTAGFQSDTTFDRVVIDSRQVEPGSLFWALPGSRCDGHDFIEHAHQRGAACCVVNQEVQEGAGPLVRVADTQTALSQFAGWYRKQLEPLVIGVTGSVGKTTTREMIHAVLEIEHRGIRSIANYNNEIGLPLSLLQLEQEHDYGVLEMGACQPGDIRQLCEIAQPEVGVITGIAEAHIEKFGNIEGIIRTKGELLQALTDHGFAVVNGDCGYSRRVAEHATCPVIFVGESDLCDIQATAIEVEADQICFRVDGQYYTVSASGRHHLTSALSAVAVGLEVGMSPAQIAEGLLQFSTPQGRCQIRQIGPWTIIDDTYNANPASMRAACQLMSAWRTPHKKIVILGDMLELGTEASRFHRELGIQVAQAGVDCLLTYGANSWDVITGATSAGLSPHQMAQCPQFDSLLTNLDCWLEPGDVVLVKGSRSTRMERVIDWARQQAETSDRPQMVAATA